MRNEQSLDTLCGALSYAMGINAPKQAAQPDGVLCTYVDRQFQGQKADRVFLYNPDAIGQWIQEKYPQLMHEVMEKTSLTVPYATVFPPKTPVCFGTMYTGAQPEVHGIQKYEKPVIRIDTLFDALLRAGKKPAIIATTNCSMACIYLEREMDYFIYDTTAQVNAKATELILKDEHDFIAVYNGNYDTALHAYGPERIETLSELRANAEAFAMFSVLIENNWKHHNTLVGFAMDHGCHHTPIGKGSHGMDIDEDMNIIHYYQAYPAEK